MTHRIFFSTCYIAPADLPTIRDAVTGAVRPSTDQELLDAGLFPLPEANHYSVCEQHRRDDQLLLETGETRWDPHGPDIPRTLITQGPNRYRDLPPDLKPKILLARVIRSTVDGETPFSIARSSLGEQSTAIVENVGTDITLKTADGMSLDLSDSADVDEAKRLLNVPDSGLEVAQITMASIDPEAHIVDATEIDPHRWAGERRR